MYIHGNQSFILFHPNSILILNEKPLHIESVIHTTVNPGTGLSCAACSAWWLEAVLCCTIPWLQDKLSQLVLTEKPEGSSHLVPAITPPAWPCLYLTVQQEVLRASFRNRVGFFWGYYMTAHLTKRSASLHGHYLLSTALWEKSIQTSNDAVWVQGAQHLEM